MSYRDDQPALEARRAELEGERDAVRRRLDAAAGDLGRKRELDREIAEVDGRLERAKESRRRVLDELRVASPCNESWDTMQGDDRARYCLRCEKHVYNLSAMTRAEAEELIAAKERSLCVRMYQRADGTLISNDCPEGAAKKRRRLRLIGAAAGAIGIGVSALALFRGTRVVQGDMKMPDGATPCEPQAPAIMGTTTVPAAQAPTADVRPPPPPTATPRR